MTEIHQYYDLPLVNYSYIDGMLILQIPIYIKHYQQQTLELFSLQTVLVPYHPNKKSSDDQSCLNMVKTTPLYVSYQWFNISGFSLKTMTKLQEI